MQLFADKKPLIWLPFEGETAGVNYDANQLTDSGIWKITNGTIKNGNNLTWSFLICLKFDVNTTLQFLITTEADVKIFKRKLSPSGLSQNSEWMEV